MEEGCFRTIGWRIEHQKTLIYIEGRTNTLSLNGVALWMEIGTTLRALSILSILLPTFSLLLRDCKFEESRDIKDIDRGSVRLCQSPKRYRNPD